MTEAQDAVHLKSIDAHILAMTDHTQAMLASTAQLKRGVEDSTRLLRQLLDLLPPLPNQNQSTAISCVQSIEISRALEEHERLVDSNELSRNGTIAAAQVFAQLPQRLDFVPSEISTPVDAVPVCAHKYFLLIHHQSFVMRYTGVRLSTDQLALTNVYCDDSIGEYTPRATLLSFDPGGSGLAAAYKLTSHGLKVTVFEAEGRAGGKLRSVSDHDLLWDEGANTMTESQKEVRTLLVDLGLRDKQQFPIAQNKRYIVRNGKPVLLPTNPIRLITSHILSVQSTFHIILEPFLWKRSECSKKFDNNTLESVRGFFQRHFGKEVVDFLIDPFVAGSSAEAPDSLSAQYSFPELWNLEKRFGSIIAGAIQEKLFAKREKSEAGKSAQEKRKCRRGSFSFLGGLQTLTDTLCKELGEDDLKLESKVLSLSYVHDEKLEHWSISHASKGDQHSQDSPYDAVIMTAPLCNNQSEYIDLVLPLLALLLVICLEFIIAGGRYTDFSDFTLMNSNSLRILLYNFPTVDESLNSHYLHYSTEFMEILDGLERSFMSSLLQNRQGLFLTHAFTQSKLFDPGIFSVLPGVGDLELLDMGIPIHCYVMKKGFEQDKCVVSALVDMYGKCRSTMEMSKVFDEMDEKDIGSCNALVTGLARNGCVDNALELFDIFKRQRMDLNVVSWTSIIASCSPNGTDIEALELFREMQVEGVKPHSRTIPSLLPACGNIAALMHGKAAHCFSLKRGISYDVH